MAFNHVTGVVLGLVAVGLDAGKLGHDAGDARA
jgi:hypothetical protein